MNTTDLFKMMKEENKNQEALLNTKLSEGNDQLKQMLNSIKTNSFSNQKQIPGSSTTNTSEQLNILKKTEDSIYNLNEIQKNHNVKEATSIKSITNIDQPYIKEEYNVETFANNEIQSNSKSEREQKNTYSDNENTLFEDEQIEEEGCIKIKKNNDNSNNEVNKIKKRRENKAKGGKKPIKTTKEKAVLNTQVNHKERIQIPIKSNLIAKKHIDQPSNMINSISSLSKQTNTIDSNHNLSNNKKMYLENKRQLKEK